MDYSGQVRASDQERDQAIDALEEHARSNRLAPAEFGERAEAASAAEMRGDLTRLFEDLPEPKPHFGMPGAEAAVRLPGKPVAGRGALRAATYGLLMSSGLVTITLVYLTGSWLWFFIMPPIAYLIRQMAKGRLPRRGHG